MAYDLLGRMTQRTEADLVSNWYYETNQAGVACNMGIGKLCEAKTSTGYDRLLSYDSLGRPASSTTTIDTAYTSSWTYDAAGRLDTTTYPQTIGGATLVVKNVYNANGYLSQIKNNNTGAAFWQPTSKNADGNILSETYGNGVVATSGYDPLTGKLISIAAGTGNAVQNQSYHYDSVGNLDTRTDAITGTNETFSHDNLNRLVTANLSGPGVTGVATTNVTYDAIGNIKTKASTLAGYNLGTYNYPASGAGSVGPHAVSSVSGTVNGIANPTYGYDANGNLQSAYGKSITWTSFDMPNSIARGTGASSFLYSPEHQRVKQMWPNPNTPTNVTVYLFDPQYEKEINGGLTEHKHYILAGSRIVALYTKRSDNSEDTRYFHADHLGSTSVVTDSAGNVLERLAYDPWGDRRAAGANAGAPDSTNAIIPSTTDRGYTGHEHLDLGGMGLIHMNGRIYDPTLGRFLSPDPTIQSPYHSQSYNRYSYVWNNPLTMTDPSGYVPEIPITYEGTGYAWGGGGNVSWAGEEPVGEGSKSSKDFTYDLFSAKAGGFGAKDNSLKLTQLSQISGPENTDLAKANEDKSDPISNLVHKAIQSIYNGFRYGRWESDSSYNAWYESMAAAGKNPVLQADVIRKNGGIGGGIPDVVAAGVTFGTSAETKAIISKIGEVTGAQAREQARAALAIESAQAAYNETGLSVAARKLESHANRPGGTFPPLRGSTEEKNAAAANFIRDLIKNPSTTYKELGRGGYEWRAPNGQGIRYESDGRFNTFLDPARK